MKLKAKMTMKQREAWSGRLFVLPFCLGLIFFIIAPISQSFKFMFNEVSIGTTGFEMKNIGFENFRYIFTVDLKFTQNLMSSIAQIAWKVPVIIISSLFIAVLLNTKFAGRTVVRAIFFMPVVVVSGVILDVIRMDMVANNTMGGNIVTVDAVFQSTALNDLLVTSGLNKNVVDFFTMVSDNVFEVLYNGGIQMLIFLAGLQSISPDLYEAAQVEGATSWESFWKITVPMITPIMLINIIYTIVDCFTAASNTVMKQVLASVELIRFGEAAAMTWVYCGIVLVLLAAIFAIFTRMKSVMIES